MDRWDFAFDLLPDLVVLFDRGFRIDRLNRAAETALSTAARPVLMGLDCGQALHDHLVPAAACPVCRARHGRDLVEWSGAAPGLGGVWSLTTVPVHDAASGGIVLMARRLPGTMALDDGPGVAARGLLAACDACEIGVHVIDFATKVVLWANDTKRRQFGRDIVGQRCFRALQGAVAPCPDCPADSLIVDGVFQQARSRLQRDSLTGDWCLFLTRAFLWPDGRPAILEMVIDVFDLPAAAAAAEAARS